MCAANTFLVERYLPGLRADELEAFTTRLAAATAAVRADGRSVRWLRSVALPEEDTCLCVFRAASREDVEEANRRAGAPYERIVPAVTVAEVLPQAKV